MVVPPGPKRRFSYDENSDDEDDLTSLSSSIDSDSEDEKHKNDKVIV